MWILAFILTIPASDEKEIDEAIQKFKTEMKSPEIPTRVQAVVELGRTQHEKTLRALGACLTIDDKSVRTAAARALGGFQEKKAKAAVALAEALAPNSREPDVQIAIFSALRDLHEGAALATAYRYLDDKNGKVAESAIGVTAAIHSRDSIDPLIKVLKKALGAGDGVYGGAGGGYDVPADETLKERARLMETAVNKALASITGERYSGPKEWETWWKKNAGTFRVKE